MPRFLVITSDHRRGYGEDGVVDVRVVDAAWIGASTDPAWADLPTDRAERCHYGVNTQPMPAEHTCALPGAWLAAQAVDYVDISWVHEYGLSQKLSNSIRVF